MRKHVNSLCVVLAGTAALASAVLPVTARGQDEAKVKAGILAATKDLAGIQDKLVATIEARLNANGIGFTMRDKFRFPADLSGVSLTADSLSGRIGGSAPAMPVPPVQSLGLKQPDGFAPGKDAPVTAYLHTVVDVESPRYARFELFVWDGKNWPNEKEGRFDVWISSAPVTSGDVAATKARSAQQQAIWDAYKNKQGPAVCPDALTSPAALGVI
jgi:hypothetical protein